MLVQEKVIKSVKMKVENVREENERLKVIIAEMLREYKSLQDTFFKFMKAKKKSSHNEEELTSLRLGSGYGSTDQTKKNENEGVSLLLRDDEKSQVRKARVCLRARCNTPTVSSNNIIFHLIVVV